MFVPVPKQNFNVYVKYEGAEWQDVFAEVIASHQHNRFAGYENLFLSFSSALRYYASSVENKNTLTNYDDSNVNLKVIKKMVRQYLVHKNGTTPNNMEIIIRISDIHKNYEYSHYYK